MRSRVIAVTVFLGISILLAGATAAQEPATVEAPDPAVALFVEKCSSCHTVGEGPKAGPDLANAHERREPSWLREMILNPSDLLDRDPDAQALLLEYNSMRMPDPDLSSEQADLLVELIVRCSAEPCDLSRRRAPVPEAQEAAAVGAPDPTAALFVAQCASCHTIGQGPRVGPDLANAHERREPSWLREMILNPSELLDRDPDARELLGEYNNMRMPDLDLSSEEVDLLVELIARCSAEPCVLAATFMPATDAAEADFLRGEALFVGNERTANGSVPCIACHDVDGLSTYVPGGTLAVNLTHVFARLGDEGLAAALQNPAFPLMNKIFADHPLETGEAFALRAFLYEANQVDASAESAASVPLVGMLGTAVVLVVLNAFWRRRLRGVRQVLTRRQETHR